MLLVDERLVAVERLLRETEPLLELRAVLEELFKMVKSMEFKPGTERRWVSSSFVRGPATVPVLVKGKQ